MKHDTTLTVTSLLSILLMTLHLAGDVVYGMDSGGPALLIGVLILVIWLYGALALPGRRSGYIILLLGSMFASAMPVIHTTGSGLGGEFAKSDGAFFFIWTLLALGAIGVVSFILSVHGLLSLRRGQRTP